MRVVSHGSSAGPFVLEGRVPGPELCSVPILPPICPLHSPRLPLESAQGLCGGVLWTLATSCALPSAHLFSIPREFLPSGFSSFLYTPRSQTVYRTIKNGSPEVPQSHPCIAQSPASWSGRASFLHPPKVPSSPSASLFRASDSTAVSELPGHTSATVCPAPLPSCPIVLLSLFYSLF